MAENKMSKAIQKRLFKKFDLGEADGNIFTDINQWNNSTLEDNEFIYSELICPKEIVDELLPRIHYKTIVNQIRKFNQSCGKDESYTNSNLKVIESFLRSKTKSKKYGDKFYTFDTLYSQKKCDGRLIAERSHSAVNFTRLIRGMLIQDVYQDIDIKNAHPVILRWIIDHYGLTVNTQLNEYIDNREPLLKQVCDDLDISRGAAKSLFLKYINKYEGDGEEDEDVDQSPTLKGFKQAMTTTIEELYSLIEKEFPTFVVKNSKFNEKGKTANKLFLYYENLLLFHIIKALKKRGMVVGNPCHDGIIVRKTFNKSQRVFEPINFTPELLKEIADEVEKETKIAITLEEKPFQALMSLKQLKEIEVDSKFIPTEVEMVNIFWENFNSDVFLFKETNKYCFVYEESLKLWRKCADPAAVGYIITDRLKELYSVSINSPELFDKVKRSLEKYNKIQTLGKLLLARHITLGQPMNSFLDKVNRNPHLLPIAGGKCVDLKKKIVVDRVQSHYFTYYIKQDLTQEQLDSSEGIEEIDQFMSDYFVKECKDSGELVHDEEMFKEMKKILGYSITAENNQKYLYIITGPSNGGKSSFFNLVGNAFDTVEMVSSISEKVFIEKKDTSHIQDEFQMLEGGLRMGYASEFKENHVLNSMNIKRLTGGDPITYRPFGGTSIRFINVAKLFIFTNEVPKFNTTDDALLQRLVMIPFINIFEKTEENRNKVEGMFRKRKEMMLWLIEQSYTYYKDPNFNFDIDGMRMIKAEETERNDPLAEFIGLFEEVSDINEIYKDDKKREELLTADELYNEYELFSMAHKGEELSKKRFQRILYLTFPNRIKVDYVSTSKGRVRCLYGYKKITTKSSSGGSIVEDDVMTVLRTL